MKTIIRCFPYSMSLSKTDFTCTVKSGAVGSAVCLPDEFGHLCLCAWSWWSFEQQPVLMLVAFRGQDRNYWTEGGWQSELALGANRCCNHKEIHNLWIKYEVWGRTNRGWSWLWLIVFGHSWWFVMRKSAMIGKLLSWRANYLKFWWYL